MRRKESYTHEVSLAKEGTKMNFEEAQQLQNKQLQLKNIRSTKDDDKLFLCNDCGDYVKKIDLPQHRIDHMNASADGEVNELSFLDNVRFHKRHPSKAPEDMF